MRSGALETCAEQIYRNRQGKINEAYGIPSAPVFLGVDIAQAITNVPRAWWIQGSHALEKAPIFGTPIKERHGEPGICVNELRNGETVRIILDDDSPPESGFWKNAGLTGACLLLAPFKFITTPFVSTMGETAWRNMPGGRFYYHGGGQIN